MMKYLFFMLVVLKASSNRITVNDFKDVYELQSSNARKARESTLKDVTVITNGFKVYYVFSEKKLNWFEALAYCSDNGMELASPFTEKENKFLKETLIAKNLIGATVKKYYYISLNDLGNRDSYIWMSNGQAMTYNDWLEKEPNHLNNTLPDGKTKEEERCGEFFVKDSKIGWNDHSCSNKRNFICEK